MRIEKNLNSHNVQLNQAEKKTKFLKFRKAISNHRFQSRQNFILKPINFFTVVTFLPFAFGFVEFVYKKSTVEKSDPFFQKNLPALRFLQPKINFETFEYIFKSNYLNGDQKNFHEFFPKNLLFGTRTYEIMFLFDQPKFIATIKKPKGFELEKFNGLSYKFYDISLGNFSSNTLSKNLDELPSYLQSLYEDDKDFSSLNEGGLFSKKEDFQAKQDFSVKQKSSLLKKHKFVETSPTFVNLLNTSTKNLTGFQKNVPNFKNQLFKDRLELSINSTQLNSEVKNFFIEKNIVSVGNELEENSKVNLKESEFSNLKEFIKDFSNIDQTSLIEKILSDLDKKRLAEEVKIVRMMSGYKYPDMTSFDLNWFYLQKSLFGKYFSANLKIEKQSLSAFSKKYNFHLRNLPATLIEIKKITLNNLETNRVFYSGPSLVLDSKKAFDWKNHDIQQANLEQEKLTFQENSLRSWFHSYLSPSNPLVQPQQNFFGIFHSPEFLKNGTKKELANFATKSFFREIFLPEPYNAMVLSGFSKKVDFGPFNASVHVPSETNQPNNFLRKDDQNFFNRGIDVKIRNQEESNSNASEQFVPLIELKQPQFSSLTTNSNVFQTSSQFFERSLLGNLDYTIPTNFSNDKSFETKFVSGRYQKISSVFSKTFKSSRVFMDNWEPLTTSSWLVVSQLSFAVLIFHTLRSLADNYGRELLGYLLDLVSALGVLDDSLKQEIEILMGERQKGFRVVSKSRKTFSDIVGIRHILPEIYEVVWFLRNSARDFALSKTLPRGILLTGPPGTGKTLLVQALAGEAQVPVVVLSGSSLVEPGESGALKLELVFQEARQVAPCIVFIDEIDTLAHKRSGVVQNPMGPDELLESLTYFEKTTTPSALDFVSDSEKTSESDAEHFNSKTGNSTHHQSSQEQLSLLTQFLIELDGIQGRDGVVVIGATNRPEVLDPALLRPGRFDKILQVGLPGQQKRVEILKFYGQTLGYESTIPWNYLGERTAGFTAADLATLMNESSIKAILNQSPHTIETIEHGIDRLTTSESEKSTILKTTDKSKSLAPGSTLSLLRLAYYQAGKIVISQLLQTHPTSVVATLWPRRPTIRALQITTNLQNSVFQFAKLGEVQERLIGCYAGKAAEFLFLQTFSSSKSSFSTSISTLGIEDLLFGQKLIYCLLEKWSFYSKQSKFQKILTLSQNINRREFRQNPEKLEFYNHFLQIIQTPPMSQALETQTSSLASTKDQGVANSNAQSYYSIPWWQQEISSELEFVEKNFANWSRIYLSNPEQSDRNPEWLPPDEFFHSSSSLKKVKQAHRNLLERSKISKLSKNRTKSKFLSTSQIDNLLQDVTPVQNVTRDQDLNVFQDQTERLNREFNWNNVSQITRDYPVQSLVLQSFNRALLLLNQNRELLDRVVIELLYKEILRQPDIELLLQDFEIIHSPKKEETVFPFETFSSDIFKGEKTRLYVVEPSWGSQSRKPLPRWIDFAHFKA